MRVIISELVTVERVLHPEGGPVTIQLPDGTKRVVPEDWKTLEESGAFLLPTPSLHLYL